MKKKAKEIKEGEKIEIAGREFEVKNIEISSSESGKAGRKGGRKVRIEAEDSKGEKMVLVRPEDYPLKTI